MPSRRALAKADPVEVDPDDAAAYVKELTEKYGIPERKFPLGYTPHRKQGIAHHIAKLPGVDTTVLNCGRRGGKSEWSAAEFIDKICDDYENKRLGLGRWEHWGAAEWKPEGASPDPFLHYVVVAPIYKLLKPLKRKMQRMLGMAVSGGLIVKAAKQGDWWLLGGLLVEWRSGDNPGNLVADAYDGVLLDEFARLKADVWEDHLQPALADTNAWAIITSTPLSKASAFYRLWATGDRAAAKDILESTGEKIQTSSRVRCVHWTTMDNTANPNIVRWALEAKGRMPAAMWKRNFTASWVAFKGQVFIEIDAGTHRKLLPTHQIRRITAGKDFGWTNPGSFSVWAEDYDGGMHELETLNARHFVIDTEGGWRNRRLRQAECWTAAAFKMLERWSRFCQWSQGNWRGIPIFFPHDNPGAVAQFEARGFNCQVAYLDRLDGLEFFQRHMHGGGLTIASAVAWTSFESLVHPDGASGRDAELWDKKLSNDHAFDAGRYACSERIQDDAAVNEQIGVQNWMAR
jgi:hypothetical protein